MYAKTRETCSDTWVLLADIGFDEADVEAETSQQGSR